MLDLVLLATIWISGHRIGRLLRRRGAPATAPASEVTRAFDAGLRAGLAPSSEIEEETEARVLRDARAAMNQLLIVVVVAVAVATGGCTATGDSYARRRTVIETGCPEGDVVIYDRQQHLTMMSWRARCNGVDYTCRGRSLNDFQCNRVEGGGR